MGDSGIFSVAVMAGGQTSWLVVRCILDAGHRDGQAERAELPSFPAFAPKCRAAPGRVRALALHYDNRNFARARPQGGEHARR